MEVVLTLTRTDYTPVVTSLVQIITQVPDAEVTIKTNLNPSDKLKVSALVNMKTEANAF